MDPGSVHVETLGVVVELKKQKSDVKVEICALTLSKLITFN